jgi:hypothetical protein
MGRQDSADDQKGRVEVKASMIEYSNSFSIDLEAENQEEAATITRLGMNAKKNPDYMSAFVNKDGSFSCSINFGIIPGIPGCGSRVNSKSKNRKD